MSLLARRFRPGSPGPMVRPAVKPDCLRSSDPLSAVAGVKLSIPTAACGVADVGVDFAVGWRRNRTSTESVFRRFVSRPRRRWRSRSPCSNSSRLRGVASGLLGIRRCSKLGAISRQRCCTRVECATSRGVGSDLSAGRTDSTSGAGAIQPTRREFGAADTSRPAARPRTAGRDDEGQPAQAINSACWNVRWATRTVDGMVEVVRTRHAAAVPDSSAPKPIDADSNGFILSGQRENERLR